MVDRPACRAVCSPWDQNVRQTRQSEWTRKKIPRGRDRGWLLDGVVLISSPSFVPVVCNLVVCVPFTRRGFFVDSTLYDDIQQSFVSPFADGLEGNDEAAQQPQVCERLLSMLVVRSCTRTHGGLI